MRRSDLKLPKPFSNTALVCYGATLVLSAFVWNWADPWTLIFILGSIIASIILVRYAFHRQRRASALEELKSPSEKRLRAQRRMEDATKTVQSLRLLGFVFVLMALGIIKTDATDTSYGISVFIFLLGGALIVWSIRKMRTVEHWNSMNAPDFMVDGKGRAKKMKP